MIGEKGGRTMGKSIYSIVLDDEVIKAADKVAYMKGTSRSALINGMLAEAFSCNTPELRNRSVFEALEKRMEPSGLRYQMTPSASVLSIHSAISYKYNPRIRYAVELYRNRDNVSGELRVVLRSQNDELLKTLEVFFVFWQRLENAYVGKYFEDGISSEITKGKYVRRFLPAETGSAEEYGNAIAGYVNRLDTVLKVFFETPDINGRLAATEAAYRKLTADSNIII